MRDAVCRECWLLICTASTAVLQAMQAAGVAPSSNQLLELVASGRVAVLIQSEMPVTP